MTIDITNPFIKTSMENELIKKAILELKSPTLIATQQYLEIHSIELENELPRVEHVDFKSFKKSNVVYFSIKNESFFLSIYFSKENNEITRVSIENGNQIYLTATSYNLTFDELSKLTNLNGFSGWNMNKGTKVHSGKYYNFSQITFEPLKSQAYNIEAAIKLFLSILEQDLEGVKKLTELSQAKISIHRKQYLNTNKDILLDIDIIKRLCSLNLGVEIDPTCFWR